MPTSQVLILVVCIVGMDLFIVPLIISAVIRGGWTPLVERYPAAQPASNAVRRDFQSFKSGYLNLGGCINVAADDAYLHLQPAWIARLMGARAASIPWDKVTLIRRKRKSALARIADTGIDLTGPRWCLELADQQPRIDTDEHRLSQNS